MNKQFLSLLLLTSFVGTSFSAMVPYAAPIASAARVSLWSLASASEQMAAMAVAAPIAGVAATLGGLGLVGTQVEQHGTLAGAFKNLRLKTLGETFAEKREAAAQAAAQAAQEAAEAAKPFYKKGYESAAKFVTPFCASVKASAIKHPYVAAGLGLATVAGLSYLVYNNFKAISLNEQEAKSFESVLSEANRLALTVDQETVWNPELPAVVKEVFTTKDTGLSKKVVTLLNQHVAYGRKVTEIGYIFEHQNGKSSPNYAQHLAIQDHYKQLDGQVVAKLKNIVLPTQAA